MMLEKEMRKSFDKQNTMFEGFAPSFISYIELYWLKNNPGDEGEL